MLPLKIMIFTPNEGMESLISIGEVSDYRPPSNTDPLSYLSNYKIYKKMIYT